MWHPRDLHRDFTAFIFGMHTGSPCPCWFRFSNNLGKDCLTNCRLLTATKVWWMKREERMTINTTRAGIWTLRLLATTMSVVRSVILELRLRLTVLLRSRWLLPSRLHFLWLDSQSWSGGDNIITHHWRSCKQAIVQEHKVGLVGSHRSEDTSTKAQGDGEAHDRSSNRNNNMECSTAKAETMTKHYKSM